MIFGLTTTEEGGVIERLPVSRKLAIGLAPGGSRKFPERLDKFLVMKRDAQSKDWIIDADAMKKYSPSCDHTKDPSESCPKCCRSIPIMFIASDIEAIFPHQLVWWVKSGRKCWGDGKTATRRTEENQNGQPWSPCGSTCPDLNRGDCGFSGDLRFVFADNPDLGSVVRIHTSSGRSIQNIFSALTEISELTGGRLAGLVVNLCVNMEHSTYQGEDGKRHSTTVPILSIKTNIPDLVESSKKLATLLEPMRKALSSRRFEVVEDDEVEAGPEITEEFPAKSKALPPAEATSQPEQTKPEQKAPEAPKQPEPPKQAAQPETKPATPKPSARVYHVGVIQSIDAKENKGKSYHQLNLKTAVPGAKARTTKIVIHPTLSPKEVLVGAESARKQAEREVQIACDVYDDPSGKQDPVMIAVEFAFKAAAPEPERQDSSGDGEFDWMLSSPEPPVD